jgi:hypothetical protein
VPSVHAACWQQLRAERSEKSPEATIADLTRSECEGYKLLVTQSVDGDAPGHMGQRQQQLPRRASVDNAYRDMHRLASELLRESRSDVLPQICATGRRAAEERGCYGFH